MNEEMKKRVRAIAEDLGEADAERRRDAYLRYLRLHTDVLGPALDELADALKREGVPVSVVAPPAPNIEGIGIALKRGERTNRIDFLYDEESGAVRVAYVGGVPIPGHVTLPAAATKEYVQDAVLEWLEVLKTRAIAGN